MSNKEFAKDLIDKIPEYKLFYIIPYLQGAAIPEEIRFRVRIGIKDKYRQAAENAGLSMAKFFIQAADEKIERDGLDNKGETTV